MSSQKEMSYIEEKLEAISKFEKGVITFTFQKEKIKLDDPSEISFLKEINPTIEKQIQMMDDELSILHTIPNTFTYLPHMGQIDERDSLLIAYRIAQKVNSHNLTRIHLFVCPENIVLDKGLNPYILHFGVKESLPPYEKNSDQLLKEVKATIASIIDKQYTFTQYIHHFETLKLSSFTEKVCKAESISNLIELLEMRIQEVNKEKTQLMTVNKKTWKLNRYILIGVTICLIPTLVYSLYSLFFIQPKQASFIEAQEKFLNNEYSEVVTILQPYDFDEMPKVTQYELSTAYLINESLTEVQKESIQNNVTLQSDPRYYEYWIHIGRGNAEEALDIARVFEDTDLILYALYNYQEQVKSNDNLDREERNQLLAEIESEIEQYEEEIDQEKAKAEEQAEEQVVEDVGTVPASNEQAKQQEQEAAQEQTTTNQEVKEEAKTEGEKSPQ